MNTIQKQFALYGLIFWKGERGAHNKTLIIPWKNKKHIQFLSSKKQAIKKEKGKQKAKPKTQKSSASVPYYDKEEQPFQEGTKEGAEKIAKAIQELKEKQKSEAQKEADIRAENEEKVRIAKIEAQRKVYYQTELQRKMVQDKPEFIPFYRHLIYDYPSESLAQNVLASNDINLDQYFIKWREKNAEQNS